LSGYTKGKGLGRRGTLKLVSHTKEVFRKQNKQGEGKTDSRGNANIKENKGTGWRWKDRVERKGKNTSSGWLVGSHKSRRGEKKTSRKKKDEYGWVRFLEQKENKRRPGGCIKRDLEKKGGQKGAKKGKKGKHESGGVIDDDKQAFKNNRITLLGGRGGGGEDRLKTPEKTRPNEL